MTLLRLIRDRNYPNATLFMRELEVDRRTILRDLDYMRDRMGMPIAYDAGRRGYYLTAPLEHAPVLEMREADLLWLFVGQRLLEQAGDGELADQVRESFRRISDLLGSTVSVRWDQLSQLLSAKTTGLGAAEFTTFHAISTGLAKHRELRFSYRKTARTPVERRHVRPIHSAFVNGQWYLFGYDLMRKAARSFVLSRMEKAVVTRKAFDPATLPAIPELLQHGFGVRWSLGEPTRVRLRVDPEIAHLIRERMWHPSQKIAARADGGLVLELQVNTFRELTNWICSWGPMMEVLEPADLRKKVVDIFRKAVAVY